MSDHKPGPATLSRRSPRDRDSSLRNTLLIALVALLLLFAFAKIASEVLEGDARSFDMYVLHGAQALRTSRPWLAQVMRDLSGLGSVVVLTLLTAATVIYLALFWARTAAALVAASVISGATLVGTFKTAFGRLRPDSAFAEWVAPGLSYPSGHATMSATVFLTLGVLIGSSRKRWSERIYILSVAALMTVLVGLSRILLGVHWATDVLGGWAFGAAWALLWLLLGRQWTREKGIEG